jgi:VWFA-related protein
MAARQHRLRRSVLVFGAALLSVAVVWLEGAAQDKFEPPRFRSGVSAIEVAVLVRDSAGRPVTDLRASELTVLDNDQPQDIIAFERVSLPVAPPAARPGPPPIVKDVATNASVEQARVFVLLLDGLHVSPARALAVQAHARRFLEQHLGVHDLAAVFTLGGPPEATEDFTSDRARLIAAVERFAPTRLRSATVERAEEERQAEISGIMLHGGKDPSDFERADRVRSLGSLLQALAGHLERVAGRRKALLLFSEGVDYNVADVMGTAQRQASDVMHAMDRAVGSLMRTNVAIYAIDPRGLAPAAGDMLESPVHRMPRPGATISPLGIEDELNESIRNLHYLSEATGGVAAVTGNDVGAAFARIVEDTSEYYVLAYTPTRPPKPGDFRRIAVRTSRPGVTVVARRGYVLRPAAAARLEMAERVPELPPGVGAPRGRVNPIPANDAAPAAAIRSGVVPELADLLSSPLPRAGLEMRVHAIPFRGDGGKAVVRLVVEVSGGSLRLEPRAGRFEERIDLAMLTVDARGRAGNGQSTRLDLRLSQEELQRVRATGVRWLSKVDLAPGEYQLRVAARAERAGVSGLVTTTFAVPRPSEHAVTASGLTLTSLPSVLMVTRGDVWLDAIMKLPPSAARRFVAGDQITAALEVYVPRTSRETVEVTADVHKPSGETVMRLPPRIISAAGEPRHPIAFTLDSSKLPPGDYVMGVSVPAHGIARRVPIEIVSR